MPRLVRRQPLAERIADYLNPHDWLLWISEELESSEYPWDEWAYPVGAGLNLVFMICRSNTAVARRSNDVFDDDDLSSSRGFFGPLASVLVLFLTIFSFTNAAYTFLRKRHYRLFERSVEKEAPRTPSARRVRVDSSPSSSSPFQLVTRLVESTSAGSRAHPDPTRDVWEISVWDPTPLNLKLFCAFSPGHIILYYLFLPVSVSDPRPSTTLATALTLALLLSLQLALLQTSSSRQSKDNAIVHKEVMNEYDAKYVHPLAQPLMRDVGVQFDAEEHTFNACEVYTPAVIVNRSFKTHANPNYAKYVDPDGHANQTRTAKSVPPASRVDALRTPGSRESISPMQRAATAKQAQQYRSSSTATDLGHLGVYSHAQSPLKKSGVAAGAGRISRGRYS